MKSRNIALLILCFMLFATGCERSIQASQDYSFTWQETRIEMHAQAAPLVKELGGAKAFQERASDTPGGLDKTYYYGGFYLSTYPRDGKDMVCSIWFADESVATEEGISLGATQQEVEKAYGAGCFQDTNACTLIGKNSRLIIVLSEGIVSSIQYEAILT